MLTYSNRRSPALHTAVKFFSLLIGGAITILGQTCTVSPDKNGGPQYNQPRPLVTNYLGGQNLPVAWPQGYSVVYVEFIGTYNGYSTSFPSDYVSAIAIAYGKWDSADNNSHLDFEYYGTNLNGLNSVSNTGNPSFQPWHQWIIVHQADLPSNVPADTSYAWQNYGSNESPYWAMGTANSRVSDAMSLAGDDVSYSASTFAHELGHTEALDDCYNCQSGTNGTIMTAAIGLLAHSTLNITGPQYCDNQQTRQTAYPN
jgi:hypothetical protein